MGDDKITQTEIIDALKRSGYLIESRLINILADQDYYTYPNETYPDPTTGKSREIDLFAGSYRTVENLNLKNSSLMIDVNHDLIIECANNPQPVVFFKRTEKKKFTIFGKYRFNKLEQEILEDLNGADFDFLNFTVESKEFHYNKKDRCSQYCSFTLKKSSGGAQKKEWLASHPDSMHDTYNKIHDFIQSRKDSTVDWINTYRKHEVYLSMIYPVIVLQGEIYESYEENGEVKLQKTNHVIFEFNRYGDSSSSLLIDIITEEYFSEYLKLVKNDMTKLKDVYVNYYSGTTLKNPRLNPDISKKNSR